MKEGKMIDTHVHYTLPRFQSIREKVIEQLDKFGIEAVIEAAISFSTNYRVAEFTRQYEMVFGTIGVHPKYVQELDDDKFDQLTKFIDMEEKILAVGETGLDYSCQVDDDAKSLQIKWFRKFIELALSKQKPLVIHCRDAYSDLIEILSEYSLPYRPGVIHCFSGTLEEAKKLIEMGWYIGVGGKFIRDASEDLERVIREIPLEAILLETDTPYLSPVKTEKTNTSMNLGVIVDELEKVKNVTRGEILWVTLENTYTLFPELRCLR